MTGLLDMIIGSTNSESLLAIANALELLASETEKWANYTYTQSHDIQALIDSVNLISVNVANMFYWIIGLAALSALSLTGIGLLIYKNKKLEGRIDEFLKR